MSTDPARPKTYFQSVTSDVSKGTDIPINITKNIAKYFIKRAREDEFIANEMRIALREAEGI